MSLAAGKALLHKLSITLLVAFTVALCAPCVLAQSVTFAGRDYPSIGINHVAADFNGDGKPDLAVAGANVSVMLGNGDGTLSTKVEYPAGSFLQDIIARDFNGDGQLDLIVTNNDSQISMSLLTGNGDGTFNAPVSFPNVTGFNAPSIVAADFDHDSRLDVVIAHQINCFGSSCVAGNSLSLLRGIGDGSFQPSEEIQIGDSPAKLAVGDFNADGHSDLGVGTGSGKVLVLLGVGDGTFKQQPGIWLVPAVDNTDIGVGDFNNDTIQDLAVAIDGESKTAILLGVGDGTFQTPSIILDNAGQHQTELDIADFNGDGFQDIAHGLSLCCSRTGDGMLGIMFGKGDGTFQPMTRYLVPGFVITSGGGSLIASDFNGDGKPDVALQVRGNNPGTTVLTNTTGRAPAPLAFGGLSVAPSSVIGSRPAEVNVTLAPGAVAPRGSLALSVSSSRTSVVTVPSTVRMIAGMTNLRFKVNTSRVTTTQTVTITVSNKQLGKRSVNLTVTPSLEPLAIGSLQVQPPSVFGGRDTTGVVNLTTGNVAPSGGAPVFLTNDNPALVATPDSVTIPAGQTSASFLIRTSQTGLTTPVTITGSYGGASKSAVLTVSAPTRPIAISDVTLTPQTVVGGSTQGVRVVVTLAEAAPPERATVSLSSSPPNVARVPSSLTIDSGFASGFADFSTASVSTPTQVTITATYGSSTYSAVLNVTPPDASTVTLSALTLNPNPVTGGSAAQGTISLSAPAAAATLVGLSSSSALASVPSSVTVPAGASAASFTVNTTSVASPASVTISATLNGTTRSASLTINPAAQTADTLAIQRAEYDGSKRTLRVEATSTSANATLQVFVTSSGQLLGTLANNGGGKYSAELSAATNPQSITVRSSLGGSATKTVVAK